MVSDTIRRGVGDQATETRMASPWPPPPQRAAAPRPPPRRFSSLRSVSVMRVPDMPTGWPSAMAPPLTLVISSVMPRSAIEARPTAANASLRSNSETSLLCLRSDEHTSELQSLMRTPYAVFSLETNHRLTRHHLTTQNPNRPD